LKGIHANIKDNGIVVRYERSTGTSDAVLEGLENQPIGTGGKRPEFYLLSKLGFAVK
jgi:hypothetical protein